MIRARVGGAEPSIVGYTLVKLAIVVLSTSFNLFHVHQFLNVYKLPRTIFATAHLIYAVWNTINDFLAGWISDAYAARTGERATLVRFGGMLWCFAFLIPWWRPESLVTEFPVLAGGGHFLLSICLWDAFYSFICIAQGALITDATVGAKQRTKYESYSNAVCMVGGVVMRSYAVAAHNDDISADGAHSQHVFQTFCLKTSALALVLFAVGGSLLPMPMTTTSNTTAISRPPLSILHSPKRPGYENSKFQISLSEFWARVKGQHNFWVFNVMNVLLESQQIFNQQYLKPWCELFEEDNQICDSVVVYLPLVASAIHLALYSYVSRYGVWGVYNSSFYVRLAACVVCFFASRQSPNAVPIFIAVNFLTTAITIGFFSIAIGDIIDEFKASTLSDRGLPVNSYSSLFYGTHAVFAKPFNSFGPIVTAAWVDLGDYSNADAEHKQELRDHGLQLLLLFPFVLTLIQIVAWKKYTLRTPL